MLRPQITRLKVSHGKASSRSEKYCKLRNVKKNYSFLDKKTKTNIRNFGLTRLFRIQRFGGKTYSERKQNADVCVSVYEPNALSCARTSSASLPLRYPLTPPSLSAPLSPLSCRPDPILCPATKTPVDSQDTRGGISWDTTREGGKNYLNTAGRKAADIALQHLTHSPPSVAPLSFPFFAHCSQWKHVKISKLRPSEHNQRAGHTQRDR